MPGGGFRDHPENINRNGRPKRGETFTDVIELELNKKNVQVQTAAGFELITAKEAVARKLVNLAVAEGNFPAIKYLMDRMDGSPRQSVSVSRGEDSEMTLQEMEEWIAKHERELADLDKIRDSTESSEAQGAEETS
jgi:hypothetical protein